MIVGEIGASEAAEWFSREAQAQTLRDMERTALECLERVSQRRQAWELADQQQRAREDQANLDAVRAFCEARGITGVSVGLTNARGSAANSAGESADDMWTSGCALHHPRQP